MKKLFSIALIILCAVVLFACGSEVTALEAKSAEVKIAVGSTVDLATYFSIEGGGAPDYSVSPADVLVPDGRLWRAQKEGEVTITATSGDLSASVLMRVYDNKKIVVELRDATFVYDGTVKNLSLDLTLPEGSRTEFRCGGEIFSGATDPGEYEIEAELTLPKGYSVEYAKKSAVLTIEKAEADLDGIRLRSATEVYDGTPKTLRIEGTLPDFVTASLEYYSDGVMVDRVVDAGVYDVKARFFVDERYYEVPLEKSARLTVTKAVLYDGRDRSFSYVYDGTEHFPTLILPTGLTARYSVLSGTEFVAKEQFFDEYAGRAFADADRYVVRADLTMDPALVKNHSAPSSLLLTVLIDKADFSSDLKWKDVKAVYTGRAYTLGYGDYDFGLYGDLPTGAGSEFSQGVPVRFFSNGVLADVHEYVDAGKYSVVAKFDMPDGYKKNYNDIEDLRYTVVIEKAPYRTDYVFSATDLSGTDFSTSRTYDGSTHKFALRFPDEQKREAFFADCEVRYFVRRGAGEPIYFADAASVLDAGIYTIGCDVSFSDAEKNKNYSLPTPKELIVTIDKVVFDMTEVRFDSDAVVYDGTEHTLVPTGVPSGVAYFVEGGPVTDAGRYPFTVRFSPTEVPSIDAYLKGRDGEMLSARATLIVEKATFTPDNLPTFSVETAQYSPATTLADRPVLADGVETSFVRWRTPTEVPTCDRTRYEAVYNPDEKNYLGYDILLTVETTPVTLDAARFSLTEQFLPYTGRTAQPVFGYDGEYGTDLCRLTYECETDATSIGTHALTDIAIRLADEADYRIEGDLAATSIIVHIYDGNLFEYAGLVLKKYKGRQSDVSVPEGTADVYRGAFSGSYVTSIEFPSSLRAMSTSALIGLDSLRTLRVPFVGAEEGGALSDPFGTDGVPASLKEVVVTDETIVSARAFRGCAGLERITYEKEVTEVGDYAFDGCAALRALSFPALERLGRSALHGCFALTDLDLPFVGETDFTETVSCLFGSDLGDNLYKNYSILSIDLSKGRFAQVPSGAFQGLTTLQKILLPKSALSYGYGAFEGTSASVALPNGLTALDPGTFAGYEGTEVALPEGLVRIGDDAFRGASSILIINIPKKVTQIGERAFFDCPAEIRFAQGSSYTRVGTRSFAGYAGKGVALPTTVSDVEDYAFEGSAVVAFSTSATLGKFVLAGCERLETASLTTEVLPEGTFRGCKNLSSVSIGNVTSVGDYAFEGCSSLRSVDLPSGLTAIGKYAFDGCDALSLMTVRAGTVPDLGVRALPTNNPTWSCYVPAASVPAYEAALEEKGYQNVVVRAIE
ncbi:MAG: leucine-rich repeat protein [Clostridia bacterium]|nr:leucine-rich repeat protein [Clostridia bacterium]